MGHCETQKAENRPFKYFVNDTQIEDLECFKNLWIHLDSKLNFHQQVDQVKNKILHFCGVVFIEKISNRTAIIIRV